MRDHDAIRRLVGRGRRAFLARSGLVFGMTGLGNPVSGARAAERPDKLSAEKADLRLGYIPLTDCAPLVVALERGHFAHYGLSVELVREVSWANIRDKVAIGALDAAQMLAGMPLAIELGISPVKERMQTSFCLGLNGNGITISKALYDEIATLMPGAFSTRPVTAHGVAAAVAARRADGRAPLRLAMVSRYSRHNYELRYWLAAAGVHPDRDVDLIVVPPVHMVGHLERGAIDGFCVGEPWNSHAVAAGLGLTVISSYEIWNNGPEKVLGMTRRFAERHPDTVRLLVMALLEATAWLDEPANRAAAAALLSGPAYLDTAADEIAVALGGHYRQARDGAVVAVPDFNVFHRYSANFPWRSYAVWLIAQMYRWGQLEESVNARAVAEAVFAPQPFREAASLLGLDYPLVDYKAEGRHDGAWLLERASRPLEMGADRFIDGREFSADALVAYLGGFDVASMKLSLAEIATQNA